MLRHEHDRGLHQLPIKLVNAMAPKLTVLNYSGGKQSAMLLWLVIEGTLPRPENFVVMNANPGMENTKTYDYHMMMQQVCVMEGIRYEAAPGPNLYEDLCKLPSGELARIDNPPYWTWDANGKLGKLKQSCTRYYKIEPMDRMIRKILQEMYGIHPRSGKLGKNVVEKWIGFAADEKQRVSESDVAYSYFRFPLIELGLTKADVERYYQLASRPEPPRSVCNACFANGLETLQEMHDRRPHDWAQAVRVDESVRDMTRYGVREKVFVSKTCIPLTQLADQHFKLTPRQLQERMKKPKVACGQAHITPMKTNDDEFSCDSGHCFL